MKALVSNLLSLLICIKSRGLIFWLNKCEELLQCSAKVPQIFSAKKNGSVFFAHSMFINFVSLTNHVVSFDQQGPGVDFWDCFRREQPIL